MRTSKNQTNLLKMLWLAPSYPVTWAYKADEVTLWDVSRGFPLSAGIGGSFEDKSEDEPTEFLLDQISRDDFDPVTGLSKREYDLYSDFTRPWRSAPIYGYPRLVRTHVTKTEGENFKHDSDVLRELSTLSSGRYLGEWKSGKPAKLLFRKLKEIATRYGTPYKPEENTLLAWLALVTHVEIYKKALFNLQTSPGGLEEMVEQLEIRRKHLEKQLYSRSGQTVPDKLLLALMADVGNLSKMDSAAIDLESAPLQIVTLLQGMYYELELAHLDCLELIQVSVLAKIAKLEEEKVERLRELKFQTLNEDQQKEVEQLSKRVKEAIRERIANMLLSAFSISLQKPPIDGKQGLKFEARGLVVSCPIGLWVELKLSEMWRGNYTTQICKGCGAIFIPTDARTLYCKTGGCANKIYRNNKKLHNRK